MSDPSVPDAPAPEADSMTELIVDGAEVSFSESGQSLLDVLSAAGIHSVKDGCSPQGQCGCCTVLVDGQARVACVTPARRVKGRTITTVDGLDPERRAAWGESFCATGGSQCGFCTPGIVVRLDALDQTSGLDRDRVGQALLAHLCRCTGWHTIVEAAETFVTLTASGETPSPDSERDLVVASRRASIEGRVAQRVDPEVALGRGGFAVDTAPSDALVAVPGADGTWVIGETIAGARAAAGKVQGRRTTMEHSWPLDLPEGQPDDAVSLRTTWVEPAYLETDASWCLPGGEPADPVANGGAFGAKSPSVLPEIARRLADEHGRPVLALASREFTVQTGPKRPPVAGWAKADGTGVIRVVRTPGVSEAIAAVAPGLTVEERSRFGPPTSLDLRAAGWAEAAVLLAGATGVGGPITSPDGAVAEAIVDETGIAVTVRCGQILDAVVLRSYCIGAAHMAWSWLTSEAIAVDEEGVAHDLTVRSFGVLRAVDTPPITVHLVPEDRPAVNGSDAVFVAVAAAGWLRSGCRQDWPVGAII